MREQSLSTSGLSMSQAQSVSNLCNQACRDIAAKLSNINNASKELVLDSKTYIETQGHPITYKLEAMLMDKSMLHATQAFLMESIRAKDSILRETKNKRFLYPIESPQYPEMEELETGYDPFNYEVDEDWGWNRLSKTEYAEYLEAEAYASHFGQFIHKGGKLDRLRTELPTIKTLEWMEVETGKKTPLAVTVHHTIDQLGSLHEKLAATHRDYEQKVNYYKAKVKNLVTAENARIAREVADKQSVLNERNNKIMTEYQVIREQYLAGKRKAEMEYEESRQKEIARVSALRIEVDPRFKPVVDGFLSQLQNEQ